MKRWHWFSLNRSLLRLAPPASPVAQPGAFAIQTEPAPKRWLTASEEETRRVGEELAARLFPQGVLLLSGDLGAGKTVLAQGIARGLGIEAAEVQSPTFTIIREHRGPRGRLVHVDLYRLSPEDVPALGLEELLAGDGVKVVEWAERLPFPLPGAVRFLMRRLSGQEREILEDESQDELLKERA